MIFEIVSGKLIASYLGNSLYTWTAVIGFILCGSVAGNYATGFFIRKFGGERLLRVLIFGGCSFFLLLALPMNSLIGDGAFLSFISFWPLRIFIHTSILLLPPAFFFGGINTLLTKLAVSTSKDKEGTPFGKVYATSMLGNITGTFATGFFLIAYMGISTIIYSLVSVMFLLCLLFEAFNQSAISAEICESTISSATPKIDKSSRHFCEFFMQSWWLAALICGFVIMSLELTAGRMLAEKFGHSLYTWTVIIGIFLAGMSLGAFLGVPLLKRIKKASPITLLFILIALLALLNPLLWHLISSFEVYMPRHLVLRILLYSLIAFVPFSILFGFIVSMSAEHILKNDKTAVSIGKIYACISLGSILGTFLTGFFMFDTVGISGNILFVAFLSALAAFLLSGMRLFHGIFLLFCFSAFLLNISFGKKYDIFKYLDVVVNEKGIIYYDESAYSSILVRSETKNSKMRELYLDKLLHSKVNLADPMDLQYTYEKIYASVVDHFSSPAIKTKSLVIGGGAYSFPRYLELVLHDAFIEVAEIDPAVTETARKYFNFPQNSSIKVFNIDGGNFVTDKVQEKDSISSYDFIFCDSVNNFTVPAHFTTVEFCAKIAKLLKDNGTYCLTLIDRKDPGKFLTAVYNTCRKVFPQVNVFSTHTVSNRRDTFVVVCRKKYSNFDSVIKKLNRDFDYIGKMLPEKQIAKLIEKNGTTLLTSNYAPVENMIADIVLENNTDLAAIFLKNGDRLRKNNKFELAIKEYRFALNAQPGWFEPHNAIGLCYAGRGDMEKALDEFYIAFQLNPEDARVNNNLGLAYKNMGNSDAAVNHFKKAIAFNNENTHAITNLAATFADIGQHEKAIEIWRKLLKLNPNNPLPYYQMAISFWKIGKLNEARKNVKDAIKLGGEPAEEFLEILKIK